MCVLYIQWCSGTRRPAHWITSAHQTQQDDVTDVKASNRKLRFPERGSFFEKWEARELDLLRRLCDTTESWVSEWSLCWDYFDTVSVMSFVVLCSLWKAVVWTWGAAGCGRSMGLLWESSKSWETLMGAKDSKNVNLIKLPKRVWGNLVLWGFPA